MSLDEKVALNWLDTIPQDLVTLKSFVTILESPYELKELVVCRELIKEPIARFRNVCDVLEMLQEKTLQDADNAPELRALMPDLVLAAYRLREFLQRFSVEHFLCRLIRNQKLVECLQQAHDGVDIFIDGVQQSRFGEIFSELATSAKIDVAVLNQSEADWRNKVDITSQKLHEMIAEQGRSRRARSGEVEEQEGSPESKELAQVVKTLLEITSKDSKLQTVTLKALWTLTFETRRCSRRGTTDSLTALVERELRAVLATSMKKELHAFVADAKLKPWFIPADDITVRNIDVIGKGGYGQVYLGTLGSKTRVVVKRIIEHFNKTALLREIQIWYQLKHPHILQFIGATFLDSDCSLVSEFAGHGQLRSYWLNSNGPIDLKKKQQLWRFFYEAALGLHYMHQLGLIHGDLKCDNILIGEDLKAKLADFGLSFKKGDHEKVLCSAASHWAAPECLDKTRKTERSFPTDVYMLGMCIVEALIDGPPYGNSVDGAVRRFVMRGTLPISVSTLAPQVQELVKKMCAFEPADRMKLEEVIAKLKQFADANNPDLLLVSELKK